MNPNRAREIIARGNQLVEFEKLDPAGLLAYFEDFAQVITTTPTLLIPLNTVGISNFQLNEITYYMNPTNAVTYRLLLFEAAEADDLTSLSKIIFDSGAAQADSTLYTVTNNEDEMPRLVKLAESGHIYYMLIWTGDPGNTPGWIKGRGTGMG